MNRVLVVVEETESTKELVREAGELAAGVEAEVYLVHVTTREKFSEYATSLADIPDRDTGYSIDRAKEGACQFAENIGQEVLEGLAVEYETIGALGDKKEQVLKIAHQKDCDHLFISGRKRSPTGKALFGDVTQSILLTFDGMVTVNTV
jgi:nucleotide-binding universal stress UspA family protein